MSDYRDRFPVGSKVQESGINGRIGTVVDIGARTIGSGNPLVKDHPAYKANPDFIVWVAFPGDFGDATGVFYTILAAAKPTKPVPAAPSAFSVATTHPDYRQKFPVGSKVQGLGSKQIGVVVDVNQMAFSGSMILDTPSYKDAPERPWVRWEGNLLAGIQYVDRIIILDEVRHQEVLEPDCTCDIKALASTGCGCGYAKWNQERMRKRA